MSPFSDSKDNPSRSPSLEVFMLGGVGHFGMNMMSLKSGQDSLLLDAGSTLPGLAHFGIRLMIPDTRNLVSDVGLIDGLVVNRLLRRGVKVIQKPEHPIHVSGHGGEEDLKEMISLLKPRYTIPIHGEQGQLLRHSELVGTCSNGNNTALQVQNGDHLCFDSSDVWLGCPIDVGPIYIDHDYRSCDDGGVALRERRLMAEAGLLVITVGGLLKNGNGVNQLQVASRGLTIHTNNTDLTEKVKTCVKAVIASASPSERGDLAHLDAEIQAKVRTVFRSKTRICPEVLTVFTETS